MNYMVEIKAFQDLVPVKQLSTGQIALWYALMYINNKCAWIEWFTAPNLMLELHTGLSRSGIQKARNTLRQHGIIDFKSNGTKATSYKLISMAKSTQESNQESNQTDVLMLNSTQGSNQDSTQASTQVSTQDRDTLNKLNKTKLRDDDHHHDMPKFVKIYEQEFGKLITPAILEQLNDFLGCMPDEMIAEAVKRAARHGANSAQYIFTILNSWQEQNIINLAGVQRADAKFNAQKSGKNNQKNEFEPVNDEDYSRKIKKYEDIYQN